MRVRTVGVRLTETGLRVLDEMRGQTARSAFLRNLIVTEYARRKK